MSTGLSELDQCFIEPTQPAQKQPVGYSNHKDTETTEGSFGSFTTETHRPQSIHNCSFSGVVSKAVCEMVKLRFKVIQKLSVSSVPLW
jgi:hypothetical protein